MNEKRTRRSVITLAAASLTLAGCVGDDDEDTDSSGSGVADGDGSDWQQIEIEDVTTGETFTLADIDDPVVIHTFATYCPTCQSQQAEVDRDYDELREQATFLDLTIDQNDDPEDVAEHAEENGYDWHFGVAPADLTGELVDEFGQSVTVSSQSPLIIVCPDGSAESVRKVVDGNRISEEIEATCS